MTLPTIQNTVRRTRNRIAAVTIRQDSLLAFALYAALITTAVWYESRLYLSPTIRSIITWGLLDLALLTTLVLIIRWFGIWRGWWPWLSNEALARRLGGRIGRTPDRLLNAYQLERRLTREPEAANRDLLEHSVYKIRKLLARQDIGTLVPRAFHPPKTLFRLILLTLAAAWAITPLQMGDATVRLLHPQVDYPAPSPFILLSITGDMQILGGDSTEVVFSGFDAQPSEIELVWHDRSDEEHIERLPLVDNRYSFRFREVYSDIRYFGQVLNPVWFSHWQEITTRTHRIAIIDRPVIEELEFRIKPPEYTGGELTTVGGNVADITALVGSRIDFTGRTNLPLDSAIVHYGERTYAARADSLSLSLREIISDTVFLAVDSSGLSGAFLLGESAELYFSIVDQRGVANANPVHYTFTTFPDYAPSLTVLLPLSESELDQTMEIPIQADIADDYGFSGIQVNYTVIHPEYLQIEAVSATHAITELDPRQTSQRITHFWNLADLSIMPGDEIRFRIEVFDNNVITGPGRAVSLEFVARFPTLADLFTRVDERTEAAYNAVEDVVEDLQGIREMLDEMDLVLKRDELVSWEQRQRGKQVLENLEDVIKAVQTMQEQIDALEASSDDGDLFSDDIMQKYDELQNLLEGIITPELEEAMRRLREAMQKLDPEKMQQALNNMKFEAEDVEAQLDRFLDIFRLALAEMKLDELVKRLTEMVEKQESLIEQKARNDASEESPADLPDEGLEQPDGEQLPDTDLAARHKEQERALDGTLQVMQMASEALRPYSPGAARELQEMAAGDLAQATKEALQQGTEDLSTGRSSAGDRMSEAGVLLNEMRLASEEIQSQFNDASLTEMSARFRRVLGSVLTLSQEQEQLEQMTRKMRSSSPRVAAMAEIQHRAVQSLSQVIEQMVVLSRQSFHITPEIGRALGRANAGLRGAVQELAENRPGEAAKKQQAGMTALNETAVALHNALAAMEESGSASGFESYLKRMQNLSQGQQGMNAQTMAMQMGQMGAMSRMELMKRLQARQRQLARTLGQILEDFPSQGGKESGMGQALQEMEDVVRDFQRRRVTRTTVDRQQRIISRLLDSQKALQAQEFKEERKGTVSGQQASYTGPTGLPDNLGERDDLILQAMQRALRSGYPQEYQVMIQNYFRQLSSAADRQ